MTSQVGYVDNTSMLANRALLGAIKTLAESVGWTTLRHATTGADHELILHSTGTTGTEDIFVGFRAYHSETLDVYNISVAGFTGYVPENTFGGQPGCFESGIPAHNVRIDYWMLCNLRRIVLGLKVGTPVYTHGYAGKFLPYCLPGQWPYPMYVGGSFNGIPTTRYSDNLHTMPYYGSVQEEMLGAGTIQQERWNSRVRLQSGEWARHKSFPFSRNSVIAETVGRNVPIGEALRDTEGQYGLQPIQLYSLGIDSVYGELDGVFQITGFNNVTENTCVVDGVTYVVLQDSYRTSFGNYIALRMN